MKYTLTLLVDSNTKTVHHIGRLLKHGRETCQKVKKTLMNCFLHFVEMEKPLPNHVH